MIKRGDCPLFCLACACVRACMCVRVAPLFLPSQHIFRAWLATSDGQATPCSPVSHPTVTLGHYMATYIYACAMNALWCACMQSFLVTSADGVRAQGCDASLGRKQTTRERRNVSDSFSVLSLLDKPRHASAWCCSLTACHLP